VSVTLTVGSLFTGIGGIDLGLERAGMRVAWQCEKDKAARSVLARRYPDIPTYDDVETLDGRSVAAVDVLCGGSPCQDISVVGDRAGLDGDQSRLFHEFMRLADELTPAWLVWENVGHLLHSNGGRDMAAVVGSLADRGYWWAYRLLDASGFGVAQRRLRVFVVGHRRKPAAPGAVLLEQPRSERDSRPSSGQWLADPDAPALGPLAVHENDRKELRLATKPWTLTTGGGKPGQSYPCLLVDGEVRRATPTECERMQGFPNDWTAGQPDSTRYRQLVPVAEWIGRRIEVAA